MPVNLTVDEQAIQQLVSQHGEIGQRVSEVTRRVANAARTMAPADKGMLRSSINEELVARGNTLVGRVYSDAPHALYVHQGTGIYGPNHQPIRPKRAKVLVFKPKGSSDFVFTDEVKGARPNPFLLRALNDASPWPVHQLGS